MSEYTENQLIKGYLEKEDWGDYRDMCFFVCMFVLIIFGIVASFVPVLKNLSIKNMMLIIFTVQLGVPTIPLTVYIKKSWKFKKIKTRLKEFEAKGG